MEKLFIPYETGIPTLAKEKGFDYPCTRYVTNTGQKLSKDMYSECTPSNACNWNDTNMDTSIPTYEQLKDWFRTKHNIHILYGVCGSQTKVLGYKWYVQIGMENQCYETNMIKDYYIGMTEAIKEALKLI